MMLAIFLTAATFVLSGALHYWIMSRSIRHADRITLSPGGRLVLVLCISGVAHLSVVALYAATYGAGQALHLGSFAELKPLHAMDVFYFSLVSYTSLGLGDIVPTGHLRLIAGVEALNGFLLISCSAAYLFLFMSRQGKDRAR